MTSAEEPGNPEDVPDFGDDIILASASPRRREMLLGVGISFSVEPSGLEEARKPGETPEVMVERLAREKATAVANRHPHERPCWVLGVDTTVVIDNEVLGKPRDSHEAIGMLSQIVGRSHFVLSGVALARNVTSVINSFTCQSRVDMREASLEEIRQYVETGEPLDKAGAYAVQGKGSCLVTRVHGSETNVIGLPLDETLELLRKTRWNDR